MGFAALALVAGACDSKEPLRKAAPQPSPATRAAPSVVRQPPPPPPPPPQESSSPQPPAAPKAVRAQASKPDPKPQLPPGCLGDCRGKETMELLGALRGRAGQARSCYERALSQDSSLQGKLLVSVRIAPSGRACKVSMLEDELGDAVLARCVLKRFRTGTYPKPDGGCLDTQVPISFVARQ